MNNKAFKEYWSNKTLGEVKGYYFDRLRICNQHKESIREKALELANLDFEYEHYTNKARNLMNDITFYKSYIKEDETDLKILKTIFDKKAAEGINQEEYEQYITNNIDIKVLINAVNDEKQRFINSGSKVIIFEKGNMKKEIVLTEQEVNELYDTMLKELIMIIKDNIGDITKVEYLRSNGNRGMDGRFAGKNGIIDISTILAGGYNIQRLHYRTLVFKQR
jgi:hypothetical protein